MTDTAHNSTKPAKQNSVGEASTYQADWKAPGAGSWVVDRSHGSSSPTRFLRRIATEQTAPAYRQALIDFGAAVDTIDIKFVHGTMYRRVVPLIGEKFDRGKLPPNAITWLVCRLHPEFRKRERTSAATLADRTYLDTVDAWAATERFDWERDNLALQAIDPADLDDGELAKHIRRLDDYLIRSWQRHHVLHASDLGPIGDLIRHAQEWGMDPVAVMDLLRGASPATTDAAAHGERIADALRSGGVDPATVTDLDTIRSVPAASIALDVYLETFGWRIVVGYDIQEQTLHELPSAVCAIVRAGANPAPEQPIDEGQVDRLRSEAGDPALFDDLLDGARRAYGLRDDNGPLTWAWPAGLLRRAYLAAGDRLAVGEALAEASHVFELDSLELADLLEDRSALTSEAIVERSRVRAWEETLPGPDFLGAPPTEPDLSALSPALRRSMGIIVAATSMLEPDQTIEARKLVGLGIGAEKYRGVARVADDAFAAIEEMEPGDVLVAPYTAPSFNAVLSIAGGVVVQEGGLLCHAAVMARELGIPAVIGCHEAMTEIRSGDLIEIDPTAGSVRILPPTSPSGISAR